MYGPGQTTFGLQYSGPPPQVIYPSYVVPSAVVAGTYNDPTPGASLIFPSAAPTRLGTGVIRPGSWATAFPQPLPVTGIAIVPPVVNVADARRVSAAEAGTYKPVQQQQQASRPVAQPAAQPLRQQYGNDVCYERDASYNSCSQTQQPQRVTSWNLRGPYGSGSFSSDVGYVDASLDLDSQDVDFTGPCNSACRQQPAAAANDSAAYGDDPFVARVRVVDDDASSTTESQSHQQPGQVSSSAVTNWDDCRPATATIYGNDGDTDSGHESHLSSATNDSITTARVATPTAAVFTARQTPASVVQQSLSASTTSSKSSRPDDDVLDDDGPHTAAFIEFEREEIFILSASVDDGDDDVQNRAGLCQSGAERRYQPVTEPAGLVSDGSKFSAWRQQPMHIQSAQVGRNTSGGWLKTKNSRTITADEKFDTHLPTWTGVDANVGGSNTGQCVDRQCFDSKQRFNEQKPTNNERHAAGVAPSKVQPCYPPPSVSDLQKQLQRQMEQLQIQHQQQDGHIYHAQGAGMSSAIARARPGSNRLPRQTDDKELIGDAFKFLDEFED